MECAVGHRLRFTPAVTARAVHSATTRLRTLRTDTTRVPHFTQLPTGSLLPCHTTHVGYGSLPAYCLRSIPLLPPTGYGSPAEPVVHHTHVPTTRCLRLRAVRLRYTPRWLYLDAFVPFHTGLCLLPAVIMQLHAIPTRLSALHTFADTFTVPITVTIRLFIGDVIRRRTPVVHYGSHTFTFWSFLRLSLPFSFTAIYGLHRAV